MSYFDSIVFVFAKWHYENICLAWNFVVSVFEQ